MQPKFLAGTESGNFYLWRHQVVLDGGDSSNKTWQVYLSCLIWRTSYYIRVINAKYRSVKDMDKHQHGLNHRIRDFR
jgi:hypothetical protein